VTRRDPWALSGAAFVILVLVAFLALGGETPEGDASAAEVVSFYSKHETREILAAVVIGLAAVVLIYFTAIIRERLRVYDATALPTFALGAGIVAAGGFLAAAAIHFALADYAEDIQPAAAQALNALDGDFFLPFAIGTVSFVLGISLIAVRSGFIPRWMGWVGIFLFIISFTPIGFIGFGLAGLWIIAISVMLYLGGTTTSVGVRPPPSAAAPG
jgi:hypothetical protein